MYSQKYDMMFGYRETFGPTAGAELSLRLHVPDRGLDTRGGPTGGHICTSIKSSDRGISPTARLFRR